jgi:hypothetical protein
MMLFIGELVARERVSAVSSGGRGGEKRREVIRNQGNGPAAIGWLGCFHPLLGILIEAKQI